MHEQPEQRLAIEPIGKVLSGRSRAIDDNWGDQVAVIALDERFGQEALAGLEAFSHLEIIFYFHGVPDEKINSSSRHPRGRKDWPKVGIFAQRGKSRPNRIGLSRCRLVEVDGTRIVVKDLDAIRDTPILDIKPWMEEFAPRHETSQPEWASELMAEYYNPSENQFP